MTANLLKLYIDINIALCRTLTIKSSISVDLLNDYLIRVYGSDMVDLNTPTTWKYYLNLSGLYHTTDTIMTVSSLDDLTTIDFTVANLQVHKATKKAYAYGTRYYNSLLSTFPDQEQLILGVLNPVDIQTAIDAKDGTILNYDHTLVEEQETTLIPALQAYLYTYVERWDVKAFGLSDDLYPASQLSIMYLNLLPKLLNIRLANAKTDHAHGFHIREYLTSNKGMDKYMPYMTLEQILYLYRNIRYINDNAGKSEQFHTLVEKLLTLRNIPLNEYTVRLKDTIDNELYPDMVIQRKELNKQFNPIEKTQFDYSVLMDKENRLVNGNIDTYDTHARDIELQLKTSNSNVVQTKDLESSMVDYSDSIPDPFTDVLYREWGYQALSGKYTSNVVLIDPVTLNNTNISVKDAYIYAHYLLLESIGVTVTDMPSILVSKHRVPILPTRSELLALTDNSLGWLADLILVDQPVDNNIVSVVGFNAHAVSVFDKAYIYWFLVSGIDDLYIRGQAERMVDAVYGYTRFDLTPDTNDMLTWLNDRGLTPFNLSKKEADTFITEIFKKSTGFYIDTTKLLSNIQRYMIEALTNLKSYTTQTIVEINDSSIKLTNWSMLRVGNLQSSSTDIPSTLHNVSVSSTIGDVSMLLDTRSLVTISSSGHNTSESFVDIKSEAVGDFTYSLDIKVIDTIGIEDITYNNQDHTLNDTVFVGYESYLDLTATQQNQLQSIY